MPTSKVPNIKDNFEDVLLYLSGYQQVQDKVDHAWLKDPQFQKVVSYMARYFCRKNSGFLAAIGYEEQDIKTIIAMYALRFMAKNYEAIDERSRYMFLMRHISQRFPRFRDLLERKNLPKHVSIVKVDFSSHDYVPWHERRIDQVEDDDELGRLEDERDGVEIEIASLAKAIRTKQGEDREMVELEVHALRIDLGNLEHDIKIVKEKVRRQKLENDAITRSLRDRLKSTSVSEIADKMAYYATVRAVDDDVRAKARQYCRANGINYSEWARQHIARHGFDESEFVL